MTYCCIRPAKKSLFTWLGPLAKWVNQPTWRPHKWICGLAYPLNGGASGLVHPLRSRLAAKKQILFEPLARRHRGGINLWLSLSSLDRRGRR